MKNKIDKITFIPSWNGHLFLHKETDTSVVSILDNLKLKLPDVKTQNIGVEKNNIEKTNETIFSSLKDEENFFCITGDHSNTYMTFKAFATKRDLKDTKLVIFDAHPDVEASTNIVSHEDYLRNLIEEKIVLPENVYLFGIRTMSRLEFDYLNETGINYYTIFDCLNDLEKIKKILDDLTGEIYLSFDIDSLDPDFAPGTYYKEWCGFNLNEIESLLKIISSKVVSGDICEYYKPNDIEDTTLNNIIKLIEIML